MLQNNHNMVMVVIGLGAFMLLLLCTGVSVFILIISGTLTQWKSWSFGQLSEREVSNITNL